MAGTQYWGTGRIGNVQATSFTTTAGTVANGVTAGVYKVRIIVTQSAYFRPDGATTAASSADSYMAANVPEYFTVSPGYKPSAISSVTGTTGVMFVTEVS